MRRADYDQIAPKYDQNAERHDNPPDVQLAAHLERRAGPFRLLDVACGTGNWLAAQRSAFPDPRIEWRGIDASSAMLEQARPKLAGVELQVGRAESLPFEAGSFDFVSCNFAFHHFEDKPRALDEMCRVLSLDGALRIGNIAPERMKGWWLFQVFPASWHENQKRFWPADLVIHELERRGLTVRAELRTTIERIDAAEARRQAEARDLSSLAILDDADFRAGMARLEHLAADGASILSSMAIIEYRAQRRR